MSAVLEKARGAAAFERKDLYLSEEEEVSSVRFVSRYAQDKKAWRERFEELQAIRSLKDDWDGEGSVAPGPEVTDGAIAFALTHARCGHTPPDCVTAGVNGTIYFEWGTPNGYYEVEVYSPCNVEQRFVRAGTTDVVVVRFPTGACDPNEF